MFYPAAKTPAKPPHQYASHTIFISKSLVIVSIALSLFFSQYCVNIQITAQLGIWPDKFQYWAVKVAGGPYLIGSIDHDMHDVEVCFVFSVWTRWFDRKKTRDSEILEM